MSSTFSVPPISPSLPGAASVGGEIGRILRGLIRDFFDPYRPERHYMRGPGPKWRKKHQASAIARTPSKAMLR